MNVALINPPFRGRFSRSSRSPGVAKGGTIYYPIWLAYAAGVLEAAGFRVKLLDAPAMGWNMRDVLAAVEDARPRMVVLDTSTPSIGSDLAAGAAVKARFPESALVLVGTHVTVLAEDILRAHPHVDAVARREYDYTLRDLARALQGGRPQGSVAGLSFRESGRPIHNPDRPAIENLDELPFVTDVYRRHLDIGRYYFAAARHPMVMTVTGRGCPHRCAFCLTPQTLHGRRYRPRSPENVVEEFERIAREMPRVREVGLEDDTFTADRGRAREISERLIRKSLRLKWYCNVRPDVDLETLRLMKRAGCRLVTAGFESGSQEILDRMNKGLRLETMRRFAADAGKAGLLVHGCIVLGYPGETRQTIRESLAFARELGCDSMQFYPLYVYPGTEAFARAEAEGLLSTTDYSRWVNEDGTHNCVLDLPGLPAEALLRAGDEALRRYHFRPGYLARKLKQSLFSPPEGWRTIKSAWAYARILRRSRRPGGAG